MMATGQAAFAQSVDVSRETLARLEAYAGLLTKWNPRINLVSKSTLDDLWHRHFLDSAQLFTLAPSSARHWADIGAGGGFPGLVIAALAVEHAPELQVTLVESDSRKATFLRTAAREMGLTVQVHIERVETLLPLNVDILSARALAPLDVLLGFAERHLRPSGIALFPKGEKAQDEIATARKSWQFALDVLPSKTDPNASILSIGGLSRV